MRKTGIPYVLCGSIRDDGPLPEVIANVYKSQDTMRSFAKKLQLSLLWQRNYIL